MALFSYSDRLKQELVVIVVVIAVCVFVFLRQHLPIQHTLDIGKKAARKKSEIFGYRQSHSYNQLSLLL